MPAMLWTTMPPAKSRTPHCAMIPPPQIMCTNGKVDEDQPGREEEHVGLEPDAIREGAGDEGRRDDREHHLVAEEHEERDRVVGRGRSGQRDAVQERPMEVAR